ncbi:transcriptional regulator, XRE family [Catenulispora acidiphila DSM 44928]|uniref:Transcriptional regulator, XRE family n=1 Tax=Catenulispora acidiphila (strain DSM 44928 / JCM 14897 / NBRC 102108 / NRRL B-24433 / ID139908) TaxID=479433 RepID=C7QBH5_CATAD|nr:helix-turn-helix transcriptional regulator [Catenulispora acidiphila]ACU70552.1 transcriptional regulator, XRE family [Catenulispora acidiphila DSM 44928]
MATYEQEPDGGRIRRLRRRAGLTQAEFGQLMGRSQGWVSGIENGDLELDSVTLIVRAASVLKVYPNEITGRPYDPGTRAEDRGHRAIPALRRVVSRHDLPPDWPVEPRSRRELEAAVEQLAVLRMAARYADLGEAAPNLIREIHAAAYVARSGEESERLHGLLARAYKEADTVAHELGYDDLSTLTTERFRAAAQRAGDPCLSVVFDYLRVRDLWAADLWPDALDLIDGAIGFVGEPRQKEQASVWGSLQLRAAITAALSSKEDEAWQRIALADETARRLGEGYDPYKLAFCSANVDIHKLAVAVEIRDGARAVALASQTRLPASFPASRRGRFHLDAARGWIYHGGYDQALNEIERAERIAPLLVRNNPVAKAAVRSLLSHERRSQRERLRRMAGRMHIS